MDQFASKRYAQKLSIRYVSTPRNQRNHRVTGDWALAATVQNCPIRGTASQFPLFIEWRPAEWQTFSTGVARLADWLCVLWPSRTFQSMAGGREHSAFFFFRRVAPSGVNPPICTESPD